MSDSVNSLQASFWVMILLQTLGSVDPPGRGPRKMPSPRSYLATLVTWGILQLASDTSDNAARAAKAIAWVVVLGGMVLGPFGKVIGAIFNFVAPPQSASASTATVPYPNPIPPQG